VEFTAKWFFRPESRILVERDVQYPEGWEWPRYVERRETLTTERQYRSRYQLCRGTHLLKSSALGLAGALFGDEPGGAAWGRWDMSGSVCELVGASLAWGLPAEYLTPPQLEVFTLICDRLGDQLQAESSDWAFRARQSDVIEALGQGIEDQSIEAPRVQRIAVSDACQAWLSGDLGASAHGRGLVGCLGESNARALERFFVKHQREIGILVDGDLT